MVVKLSCLLHLVTCRLDILVHPEQIGWIILVLEGNQTFVVRAVGRADLVFLLLRIRRSSHTSHRKSKAAWLQPPSGTN